MTYKCNLCLGVKERARAKCSCKCSACDRSSERCGFCQGTGHIGKLTYRNDTRRRCEACNGRGESCSSSWGTGWKGFFKKCNACNGKGFPPVCGICGGKKADPICRVKKRLYYRRRSVLRTGSAYGYDGYRDGFDDHSDAAQSRRSENRCPHGHQRLRASCRFSRKNYPPEFAAFSRRV